jgi:hypothetical protein
MGYDRKAVIGRAVAIPALNGDCAEGGLLVCFGQAAMQSTSWDVMDSPATERTPFPSSPFLRLLCFLRLFLSAVGV